MIDRSSNIGRALRSRQRGFLLNPSRFASSGGGGADPHFASVSSLIHFEGADGSATLSDVKGKAWTANGNAQLDTAQFKFGAASGLFDGSGDYFSTTEASNLLFSSAENYTIEFWLRLNSTATRQIIAGNPGSPIYYFDFRRSGTNVMSYVSSGTNGIVTGVTVLSAGQWYHVAATRSSGMVRLFIDGNLEASGGGTNNSAGGSGAAFQLGSVPGVSTQYLNGWVDEFRFTKGVARYTSSFAPPSAAFPDS